MNEDMRGADRGQGRDAPLNAAERQTLTTWTLNAHTQRFPLEIGDVADVIARYEQMVLAYEQPLDEAEYQIALRIVESAALGVRASRDAWKAYAEHRETCSQDCYHEFSGKLVLCVEGQRLRDAAVAS